MSAGWRPARENSDGLHKPSLRFGVECVKRQGGFTRSGYPGKNHHGITGKGEGNVPEVMRPGSMYSDAGTDILRLCIYAL